VTQARTHTPHPTQAAPITGRPCSSKSSAPAPTGHTRAHTPHSIPWKAMQRPVSSARSPNFSRAQLSAGGTSAPVGQTPAQNIPSHTTHGSTSGRITGVEAARPAEGGAETTACTGHASMQ